jgi:hypothetical protein
MLEAAQAVATAEPHNLEAQAEAAAEYLLHLVAVEMEHQTLAVAVAAAEVLLVALAVQAFVSFVMLGHSLVQAAQLQVLVDIPYIHSQVMEHLLLIQPQHISSIKPYK